MSHVLTTEKKWELVDVSAMGSSFCNMYQSNKLSTLTLHNVMLITSQ